MTFPKCRRRNCWREPFLQINPDDAGRYQAFLFLQEDATMVNRGVNTAEGIARLMEKFKEEFRRPENLRYYTRDDYNDAEKRYVAYRLKNG